MDAAREAARDGHKANERADFPAAAVLFDKAVALAPESSQHEKATFLLSAGNMMLKSGMLPQAKERYDAVMCSPALDAALRAKCEAKLAFLDREMAAAAERQAKANVKSSFGTSLLDEETADQRHLRLEVEARWSASSSRALRPRRWR